MPEQSSSNELSGLSHAVVAMLSVAGTYLASTFRSRDKQSDTISETLKTLLEENKKIHDRYHEDAVRNVEATSANTAAIRELTTKIGSLPCAQGK